MGVTMWPPNCERRGKDRRRRQHRQAEKRHEPHAAMSDQIKKAQEGRIRSEDVRGLRSAAAALERGTPTARCVRAQAGEQKRQRPWLTSSAWEGVIGFKPDLAATADMARESGGRRWEGKRPTQEIVRLASFGIGRWRRPPAYLPLRDQTQSPGRPAKAGTDCSGVEASSSTTAPSSTVRLAALRRVSPNLELIASAGRDVQA